MTQMINLIPYPSGRIEEKDGFFTLKETLTVNPGPFSLRSLEAFRERTGVTLSTTSDDGAALVLAAAPACGEEGYRLTVEKERIGIAASTERGIIWALTTLAVLKNGSSVPCVSMEDSPRFPHRGLSLDCARHFFRAEEVKKVIEEISLAKMNVLHWHLSDDQGWRIESRSFPGLNGISSEYYTQDEIRDVVAFAALRGVEIIPEIDVPGHTRAILSAYPEYSCSGRKVKPATAGGIYSVILCAGKEETFSFLARLLDEIIPLFPSGRFHIGGDEAPKSEWKKCPYCLGKMKDLGLTSYEDLQGYFTARVIGILKEHGKKSVCWNDTLLSSHIPEDVTIQYWTLQHRIPMEEFVKKGGRWIYSDMFEVYLDYPYSMTDLKKVYETTAHLGKKSYEDSPGFEGYEGCLWAEHITDGKRLENLLFPRILALAELNWCGRRDYREFRKRLTAFAAGEMHRNMDYTPSSRWEPRGRARRKEAVDYFVRINSMPPEVKAETVEAAAPNREFASAFMKKFFRPLDIPAVLAALLRKR